MNPNLGPELAPLMMAIGIAGFVLMVIVHVAFAVGVYRDATTTLQTRTVWFVSPFIWAVATLLGGVLVATAFWVVHYSRLRPLARA
jgi:hypothetical protein